VEDATELTLDGPLWRLLAASRAAHYTEYTTSIVNCCWSGFPCKWWYINVATFNLLTLRWCKPNSYDDDDDDDDVIISRYSALGTQPSLR